MRIKKLSPNKPTPTNEPQKTTDEQLQNEFNFYKSEELLTKLLKNNLISQEEFNKISKFNRQKFNPFLGSLMYDKP